MEEIMQSSSHVDNKTTLITVEHKEITVDKWICYETFFLMEPVTLTPKTIVNCSFSLSFGKYQNAFFIHQNLHVKGFFPFFLPVLFAQVPKALSGPDI